MSSPSTLSDYSARRKDAVPVIMTHGWLGSFIEFLPLVEYLSNTYSEENLAVHLVVA